MVYLILVDGKVHHAYDDPEHSTNEKRRLENRGKTFETCDTRHHVCWNVAGGKDDEPYSKHPCEGCVAESHLLAYLLTYARGVNHRIDKIPGAI